MRPARRSAFGALVSAVGVAAAGSDLAGKNLLLDFAPDEARRPVYIGVNDTLIAVPTLLLVGAGAAIDVVGFRAVFILAGVVALLATLLALTWRGPRAA